MLLGGLIITVLTGGAVATAGLLKVHTLVSEFSPGPAAHFQKDTVTPAPSGKPQTILLVGSDHRFGDAGPNARSDTLMLVRLDPHQQAITVLSVPRDLAVPIPGHGLDKINDAYSFGGLDLTARTVKTLLSTPSRPFRINHAVSTTFGGFVHAIDQIKCVYIDVDRRYYHSNAGLPVSERYAEINIPAGYQRLCGHQALAYVRFRHSDNDLVRSARQQGFLRAAKDQLNHQGVVNNIEPLIKIFGKATQTDSDLRSSRGVLRLAKLAIYSSGRPVREIHFPATLVSSGAGDGAFGSPATPPGTAGLGDYVTTTPAQLRTVVDEFLHPGPPRKVTAAAPARPGKGAATRRDGLQNGLRQVRALARAARSHRTTRMPLYAPALLAAGTTLPAAAPADPNPRRYVLRGPSGRRHAAYRMVMALDASQQYSGQFWGVEGTTWRNPPLLAAVHQTRQIGGRSFDLYTDGGRLRLVAWRTPKAVYWVANTLSLDLTNPQMLGIAGSLTQVRAR
jgi:LCP family protein required for cell wall assembly